jgi:hypothetical protein
MKRPFVSTGAAVRLALAATLLCGAVRDAPPHDAGRSVQTASPVDEMRRLAAARKKLERLTARVYAERPDLLDAEQKHRELRGRLFEGNKGPAARTREFLDAQLRAGNRRPVEDFEALKNRWSSWREADLLQSLHAAHKFDVLFDSEEYVEGLRAALKRENIAVPAGADRDARQMLDALVAARTKEKARLGQQIAKLEAESGLPDHALQYARYFGVLKMDASFYEGYATLRTPAELRRARDEVHWLELQLPARKAGP